MMRITVVRAREGTESLVATSHWMLQGAENTNDVREMVLWWVTALAGSGESFRKVIFHTKRP